jgi:hypothetical protein
MGSLPQWLVLATLFSATTAQAAATLYTSQAAFQAAATTDTLATFEGLPTGVLGSMLVTGGARVSGPIYVAPAGSAFFGVPNTTQVLTANGDENWTIERDDGGSFSAIGFDYYTNPYAAPVFTLHAAGGAVIASFTVAQTPSTLGFIAFTSTTPIAYLTTLVDRGFIVDTGIDNLTLGTINAVPEGGSAAMLLAGLAGIGTLLRRRRRS